MTLAITLGNYNNIWLLGLNNLAKNNLAKDNPASQPDEQIALRRQLAAQQGVTGVSTVVEVNTSCLKLLANFSIDN